jgi:4-hydroxybenzoate polyprenyltransferase
LAHLWLGTALALAPLGAWVALRPEPALAPLVLGLAVMLWVAGFDIIYACQDVDFDRTMRLHSVPARFGVARALRIAATCHLGMVLLLAALPVVFPSLGWIYRAGVAAIAILLLYEHSLVSADDLTRVNRAFFHVNAVVSIGLFLVGSIDLWLGQG